MRHRTAYVATLAALSALMASGVVQPAQAAPAPLAARDQTPVERAVSLLGQRSSDPALGTSWSGTLLVDGRQVWGRGSATARMPASVTKLLTTAAALERLGPGRLLPTGVLWSARTRVLTLRGGGDPLLTAAGVCDLASRTAAAIATRSVTVRFDASLFAYGGPATGWTDSYVGSEVSAPSPLLLSDKVSATPAKAAAKRFVSCLRSRGFTVRSVAAGRAPEGAVRIARTGHKVGAVVRHTLTWSDNTAAEVLARLVARHDGRPGTFADGAASVVSALRGLGVDLTGLRLYDGSGLSRADRLTTRTLTSLLTVAAANPRLSALRLGLPVAGRTGTLGPEFLRYVSPPTKCAAGKVEAKTGTLTGAIGLAGYAHAADGTLRAFAFVVSGRPSTLETRTAVDKLVATLQGCYR